MTSPVDLYGLYAHYYDEDRPAEFAALFAVDATFTSDDVERARGRAAIEEMARTGRAALAGVRHLISSVAVDVDGDTATGSAYVQAVQVHADTLQLVTLGRYDDTFVREDGRWRFRVHRYTPLTSSALAGARLASS
ncbi:nuclear transport factor 2 family protein [Pseudonocardia kujensis]|uniref:nuclear transport factor 2 family protein n=1 Tax=Pseudonocardia kujensis TaxID=1128675 RepID=UPI001E3B36DC|nr:nuclear transport factor 2 family protein [Pseudonocardia kujensis]MCE0762009.1 nuclear transport factor 2 family protein [Pseudonocardia kujensis]